MLRKEKIREYVGMKRPKQTADKFGNATYRDESKDIGERRVT